MLSVLELLFIILMKLSKYLRALVELRSGVKLVVSELAAWSALKNSYECFKSCPRCEFNASAERFVVEAEWTFLMAKSVYFISRFCVLVELK